MKDVVTLKGTVSGATYAAYHAHELEQLAAGKSHHQVLDAVVSAGLAAGGGAAASPKAARTSSKKK